MRSKGRNDYCVNCEEFNTVLNGVCCRCAWNVKENRVATDEEVVEAENILDEAISIIDQILEEDEL